MTHISRSTADTLKIAAALADSAKPGDIFCLTGPLGAGKTEFARGLAQGLGFPGQVTSPTFGLCNVYAGGRLNMYHFDFYRLDAGAVDLADIGLDDYFGAGGVCAIEWALRMQADFFGPAVWVDIAPCTDDPLRRQITIT